MLSITCHIQKHTFICFLFPSFTVLFFFVDSVLCLPPSFNFKIPLNWRDDKLCWLKLNIKKSLDVAAVVVAIVLLSSKLFVKLNKSMKQQTNDRRSEKKYEKRKIPLNTYRFLNNKIFTIIHNLLSERSMRYEPNQTTQNKRTKKYNLKSFFSFRPIRLKISGDDIIKFETKNETNALT